MGSKLRAIEESKGSKQESRKHSKLDSLVSPIVSITLPAEHHPERELEEKCPLFVLVATYLSYFVLLIFGHVRDFFGKIFKPVEYRHLKEQNVEETPAGGLDYNGYAPLNSDFESYYTRRMYMRIRDCWHRPVTGVPTRTIKVLERFSTDMNKTFKLTGVVREVINLSSYNYLGFAQNEGSCTDAVLSSIEKYGISVGSPKAEVGTLDIHNELEREIAEFVGKEAALVFSMGFATNSTMIPALLGPGCLIISDELNHSSLVFGSRSSGAAIKVFKHNDMKHLEEVVRTSISQGQPRTHRPWKKILVIVEGLYSMEGTVCRLPELVRLKHRYKFYLFVDEAHSIGALGPRGKGVCDFWNIDPINVDVLMGTFTKSFGAAGGYIAGDKILIDNMRRIGLGPNYCEPISPPIAQQILSTLRIIAGNDGTTEGIKRLNKIRENSIYFMRRLKQFGFIVYGDEGSPVIPMLIFNPGKIAAFSREALARGIAVVVVGYPATPIISSRARFCISAAHTKEDLDYVLDKVSEIGDILQMKVSLRNYQSSR